MLANGITKGLDPESLHVETRISNITGKTGIRPLFERRANLEISRAFPYRGLRLNRLVQCRPRHEPRARYFYEHYFRRHRPPITMRYFDPSYLIRSSPANAADSILM